MMKSLLNFRDIGGVPTAEGRMFMKGIVSDQHILTTQIKKIYIS